MPTFEFRGNSEIEVKGVTLASSSAGTRAVNTKAAVARLLNGHN